MQLRINNHVLPSETFLGDEFSVEITAVDPTRESCPLISTFTAALSITAVCKESRQELVLSPSESPVWVIGGVCQMKLSLDETSLVNQGSIGKAMEIVVTFEGYGRVEVSSAVEIIRARLQLDCPDEMPAIFFKDAKTSTIPVTLSLRDRSGRLLDEDCNLVMKPLYEDLDAESRISQVADCSILSVVGDARLRRGKGRVYVRLETYSQKTEHRKRRFIVQASASLRSLGIASVLTAPVLAQAKDHRVKNSKKQSKKQSVASSRRALKKEPKIEKTERVDAWDEFTARAKKINVVEAQALRFQLTQLAIGEYVKSKLESLRWVEDLSRPEGAAPFYLGVTNPNRDIDDLKARLKSFLAGDMCAFDDCIQLPPLSRSMDWGGSDWGLSQDSLALSEGLSFDSVFKSNFCPPVKAEPGVKVESGVGGLPGLKRWNSVGSSIEDTFIDHPSLACPYDDIDMDIFGEDWSTLWSSGASKKRQLSWEPEGEDNIRYAKTGREMIPTAEV
jgi:hypothetical protein